MFHEVTANTGEVEMPVNVIIWSSQTIHWCATGGCVVVVGGGGGGGGSGGGSGGEVTVLQLGEIMLPQDDTGEGSGEGKGETLHTIFSQVSLSELCRTMGDDTKLSGCKGTRRESDGLLLVGCVAAPIIRYLQLVSRCRRRFRAWRNMEPQSGHTPGWSDAPRTFPPPVPEPANSSSGDAASRHKHKSHHLAAGS